MAILRNVVLVMVVLALGGCSGMFLRLNILGEQRYKVDTQVYGVFGMSLPESELQIGLLRSIPQARWTRATSTGSPRWRASRWWIPPASGYR